MEHLLKTFPNRKFDANIVKAKDIFIYTSNKKKLMDMTGGFTGHAILGWGIKSIEQAIQAQLKKYPILITKFMVTRIGKNYQKS